MCRGPFEDLPHQHGVSTMSSLPASSMLPPCPLQHSRSCWGWASSGRKVQVTNGAVDTEVLQLPGTECL